MSQDLGYDIVLPSHLLLNENLEANAKLFYGVIRNLTRQCGYCYACNSYLATQMNVQERAIRRWLQALEKEGYITRSFDERGVMRHIQLSFGFQEKNRAAQKDHPPGQKRPPPPVKKDHQKEDSRKKIIKSSSKEVRKHPSKAAAPAAAPSFEEEIKSSKIPPEDQQAAIDYYYAYKDIIDRKKSPVAWVIKMWDLKKIDGGLKVAKLALKRRKWANEKGYVGSNSSMMVSEKGLTVVSGAVTSFYPWDSDDSFWRQRGL